MAKMLMSKKAKRLCGGCSTGTQAGGRRAAAEAAGWRPRSRQRQGGTAAVPRDDDREDDGANKAAFLAGGQTGS